MASSVRAGITLVLLSFVGCTDAPTAPSASTAAATDQRVADTRLAARPFIAVTIGDLGGGSALARNINSLGVVVGSSMTAGGEVHAFVWNRDRGMRDLGTLSGDTRSDAAAINLLGEVVGVSGDRAVRWDRNGRIRELLAPGAERAAATDINVAGIVSGWAVYPREGLTPRRQLPVLWNRSGAIISLGVPEPRNEGEAVAVNDLGLVAATVGADIGHGTRAATWRRSSGWRLLEPQVSDGRATDLNNRGDVIGVDLGQPFNPPPLLWRHDGTLHQLSPRGGDVRGINILGQMVGRAVLEEFGPRVPVLWNRDLTILPLAVPEDMSSVVNAISDVGEIVGGIGSAAVIWTRYPGTIRQLPGAVVASRTATTGAARAGAARAGTAQAGAARAAVPAWLTPEYQRCTRRPGPLQAGEAICGGM